MPSQYTANTKVLLPQRETPATGPLLVEFIGLPGAGKTTVAQLVIKELTNSGDPCFGLSTMSSPEALYKQRGSAFSKLRTFYYILASCFTYRRIARNAFRYAIHITPMRLLTLQRLLGLFANLRIVQDSINRTDGIIVLDQGILQNIWSLAVFGNPPSDPRCLEQLVQAVLERFSPVTVVFDLDVRLAVERITTRPTMRSRFDQMAPNDAQALLRRHSRVFTQIVNLVDELGRVPCFRISGSQPITQNVARITSLIREARAASRVEAVSESAPTAPSRV